MVVGGMAVPLAKNLFTQSVASPAGRTNDLPIDKI